MDLIFSRNERAKAQLLEDNNGRQYVVVIRDEVQNQISSNIFTEKRVDIYDLSGTSSTENSSLSFSLEDVSTSYPLIHNTTREKIFYRSDVEVLKFIDEDIFLSFESGLYRFNLLDQNLQLVYEVVPYLEDSATMALFPFETSDGFSFSEHHVVSADSAVFFDNEGNLVKKRLFHFKLSPAETENIDRIFVTTEKVTLDSNFQNSIFQLHSIYSDFVGDISRDNVGFRAINGGIAFDQNEYNGLVISGREYDGDFSGWFGGREQRSEIQLYRNSDYGSLIASVKIGSDDDSNIQPSGNENIWFPYNVNVFELSSGSILVSWSIQESERIKTLIIGYDPDEDSVLFSNVFEGEGLLSRELEVVSISEEFNNTIMVLMRSGRVFGLNKDGEIILDDDAIVSGKQIIGFATGADDESIALVRDIDEHEVSFFVSNFAYDASQRGTTILGANTGYVVEDDADAQIASGNLAVVRPVTFLEATQFQDVFWPENVGDYGRFHLDTATGDWTYTLNNDSETVQSLPEGAEVTDSLIVSSLDGTASETITVTIRGVNDPASITGDSTGLVVEDDADRAQASGVLSVTDPDAGEDRFAEVDPAALVGDYGSFSFDPESGAWAYMLDNDRDAVQALPEGAEVTDSLSVTSLDGTASETITVTIRGTNDPASITGDSTGLVVEDDAERAQASGVLTVTDPDAGEDRFAEIDPAALAGDYGSFSFDPESGAWSYMLDNDLASVQALPEGAEVTDGLSVTSLDGTASETITVTILRASLATPEPDETITLQGVIQGRSGDAMDGVTVTFSPEDGSTAIDVEITADGFAISTMAGASGRITGSRDYSPETDGNVTALDALNVLRLAVGLSPSWGLASPMDFIAADINQDGQVTALDALEVLRAAVGLQSANQPRWFFMDSEADLSHINRNDTRVEEGIRFDPAVTDISNLSMRGVLLGNMQEYA